MKRIIFYTVIYMICLMQADLVTPLVTWEIASLLPSWFVIGATLSE